MLFMQARSAMEGCAWPPLPEPADASVLALYWQLRESQWWSPAQLAAAQQAQLTELLAWTWQHVPFYRERLEAVGIKPGSKEFRWHALRPLTRRELIDHEHELIAAEPPAQHGRTSVSVTSGSSGMTVRVTKPAVLSAYMSAFMLRELDWHQRDVNKTLASIRVARGVNGAERPPGASGEGWGAATRVLASRGKSHLLHIDVPMAEQLEFLRQARPAYLMTYPSNLQHLLYEIQRQGAAAELDCIEQVRTISEPVEPALRALCREVLGVKIVDEYSAQEVGSIAIQSPDRDHYLVNAESLFVEVLHDDGRRCQPGETGRVHVTPLHNFAMPLIRYDIGDRAEVGEPCPSGRGLPVIKRILGRQRNVIRMPDGTTRWPLAGNTRYREIAPVVQFQFVQTALEHFDVNLVVERPLRAGEETALKAWIVESLGHPFALTLHYFDEIPRGPGGKFEDFVSRIV